MVDYLLDTPSEPLPEGVFLLPVCTDREGFALMLSALDAAYREDNDVRVLADFLNAQNGIEDPSLVTCGAIPFPALSLQWDCFGERVRITADGTPVSDWFAIPCVSPNSPDCTDTFGGGCGDCDDCEDCEDCEDDMSKCCLRFYQGKLQQLVCGQWEDVPGQGEGTPVTLDDGVKEAPEGQEEDWACSKATVIADTIWQIATYAVQHFNDPKFIWDVQDEVGLDLSNAQLLGMQEFLFACNLLELEEFESVLSGENKTLLTCMLSRVLDGSNNDIGENQTRQIEDAVRSLTSMWTDPLNWTFLSQVVGSVGRENWRIKTRNAVYTPGNCCPEEGPEYPPGTTWAKIIDLRESLYSGAIRGNKSSWVEGQGVVADISANFEGIAGYEISRPSPASTCQLLYVELHYSSWPTAPGKSVSAWTYHHPNVLNSLASFWGRSVIAFEVNETVNQGEKLEFGNANVGSSDPLPSGTSVLTHIIIAGSGPADPYPELPNYGVG